MCRYGLHALGLAFTLTLALVARAGDRGMLAEQWRDLAERRAGQSGRPVPELAGEIRRGPRPASTQSAGDSADASIHGLADPPVITVGNDIGGCDFFATSENNGLQEALDAASTDENGAETTEIRLADSGDYSGRRYFINDDTGGDQSVTIVGGFEFCDSTETDGVTTLDATGATAGPVILIDEVTAFVPDPFGSGTGGVSLANIRLQNASGSTGGGIAIGNNNFVIGDNLLVIANAADDGGGIHLLDANDGESTTVWLADSAVASNEAASNGGGIYCSGARARVLLAMDTRLAANNAQRGGGLYAAEGCTAASFASYPDGIFGNHATVRGGGGYIVGTASMNLSEDTGDLAPDFVAGSLVDLDRRVSLRGNTADDDGGGLYVTGPGSEALAENAWIVSNQADADADGNGVGGGVRIASGASFAMDRTLAGDACHSADRCSRLAGNSAASGGGIWALGDGVAVDIRQTWIENNSADNLAVAVLVNNNGGDPAQPGTLFMEGNMIVNNPASLTDTGGFQGVVDVQSNTQTIIAFTTFADNLTSSSGRDLIAFNEVNVDVFSSIFRESTGDVFNADWDANTQGMIDCAIVHETSSLPPDQRQVIVDDPQFVAPGDGDYHIADTSPAADFCDTLSYAPQENDIDGEARGIDAAESDRLGRYDIGADEKVNAGTVQFATAVAEVMEDAGSALITVTRTGGSDGETTFDLATMDGTAVSGDDFDPVTPNFVHWAGGEDSPQTVEVPIIDDDAAEAGTEKFTVELFKDAVLGAAGTPSTIEVRIFDDESIMFADGFEGGS